MSPKSCFLLSNLLSVVCTSPAYLASAGTSIVKPFVLLGDAVALPVFSVTIPLIFLCIFAPCSLTSFSVKPCDIKACNISCSFCGGFFLPSLKDQASLSKSDSKIIEALP